MKKSKAVDIKRETSYTTAFVYKQAIRKEDIFIYLHKGLQTE